MPQYYMPDRLKIYKELFILFARNAKSSISSITSGLVGYGMKLRPLPELMGQQIQMWEFELLRTLFPAIDWLPIYSIVVPSFEYYVEGQYNVEIDMGIPLDPRTTVIKQEIQLQDAYEKYGYRVNSQQAIYEQVQNGLFDQQMNAKLMQAYQAEASYLYQGGVPTKLEDVLNKKPKNSKKEIAANKEIIDVLTDAPRRLEV